MPKLAIITGHSRGLGEALANTYLNQGYEVIGLARKGRTEPPAALHQFELDLSDETKLLAWLAIKPLQTALEKADEVILINNAGVVEPNALIGQQNPTAIVQAVKINVLAPLLLTNAIIALTETAHLPLRIAHISSGAGRQVYPGWSVYGATKAALDQHASVIAAEKRPQLRIASIAPGVVGTDMQAQIRAADENQFPLRHKFIDLHAEKQLQTAEATALTIAAMIAAADYGAVVCRDVRE